MPNLYDLQTDTHLSKDYNKVLQGCMILCNQTKFSVESTPHYEILLSYFAAIYTFFNNSFFLFENLKYKDQNYSQALMDKMQKTRLLINTMKLVADSRTQENFYIVLEECSNIHMMIMGGLQQRKMLVRMSETEPKGARSIEHWEDKKLFNKEGLIVKKDGNQKYI